MIKNDKQELVSVIIPVYNTAHYIGHTIHSVISQTYSNVEIIIIDDGSTDGSDNICAEIAKSDRRIRVVRQKNAGVSAARNKGLSVITGELVVFVDSDDAIHPRMIEMLYQNLITTRSDISMCGYTIVHTDGAIDLDTSKDDFHHARTLSPYEAIVDILYAKGISGNISGKMYRSGLLHRLLFNQDIYYAEDMLFSVSALAKADKACFTSLPLYYYRARTESAMGLPFSPRRMTALKAYEIMQDIFSTNSKEYRAVRSRLFMEAIGIVEKMPLCDNEDNIHTCMNIIKDLREEVLYNTNVKITYKIYALVSFFSAAFMQRVIRLARSK